MKRPGSVTLILNAEFPVCPPRPGQHATRVAEQFGVGRQLKTRAVWHGQEVTLGPGRLLLFTGRSGSGKSTALALLEQAVPPSTLVQWLHRQQLTPGVALLDQFANDDSPTAYARATRLLTRAGLGDSKLWILAPEQLSDGQRYRAALAALYKNLPLCGVGGGAAEPGLRLALIDEFAAVLDRTLAETVARNLRRLTDETGICAAVATTHEDVAAWLAPDEWWHRPDPETAERRTVGSAEGSSSAVNTSTNAVIEIPARVAADFIRDRHYRGQPVPGSVCSFGLFDALDRERLIGAIMFSHPTASLQSHLITGCNFYATGLTAVRRIQETLRINRLVIDDAYRGRGLGAYLVRRSLRLSGAETVLVVAEMAKHNPVFAAAGMRPAGVSGAGRPCLIWHRALTETPPSAV